MPTLIHTCDEITAQFYGLRVFLTDTLLDAVWPLHALERGE
jgi:hypothetical protein